MVDEGLEVDEDSTSQAKMQGLKCCRIIWSPVRRMALLSSYTNVLFSHSPQESVRFYCYTTKRDYRGIYCFP